MDNRQLVFWIGCRGLDRLCASSLRQLPYEEIVYIGDSARAPYGPRPAEQIVNTLGNWSTFF